MMEEHGAAIGRLPQVLRRQGIDPGARHNALADAFATAQLFQIAQRRAASDGQRRMRDLLMIAGEHASGRVRHGG